MLKECYDRGRREALARLKIGNLAQGAQAYNPALNGQAPSGMPRGAPASVSPPIAANAAKSKVLG